MRRRLPNRPSTGLVVALVALFVALGGSAAAKLIITGANIKDRSITGVKIKKDSLTGTEIKESSLSKVPSAQNADMLGGKIAAAYQPASQWALITANAAGAHILAQSGGLTVERFAAGVYVVDAGKSVVGKPLSATFSAFSTGFVSVSPCGGSANNPGGIDCPLFNDTNHVFVRTMSTAVVLSDSTFYLSIGG